MQKMHDFSRFFPFNKIIICEAIFKFSVPKQMYFLAANTAKVKKIDRNNKKQERAHSLRSANWVATSRFI